MEKVSCIIITRDTKLNPLFLDRLETGFFDEILIKFNCPSVYDRYLLAQKARNEIIYVMDDDNFVNYQVLFNQYDGRITNTMTLPFQRQYEPLGCTLVGWGCYFPKSMLSIFDKYIARYGKDDEHLLREADRIFTYLNKPFNTVIMPHEDLPRATSEEAMWKNPNHFPSMNEALRKCSALD